MVGSPNDQYRGSLLHLEEIIGEDYHNVADTFIC